MGSKGRYRPADPWIPKWPRIDVHQLSVGGVWYVVLREPNGKPGGLVTALGEAPTAEEGEALAHARAEGRVKPNQIFVAFPRHNGLANGRA